jgi:hypothetical protein
VGDEAESFDVLPGVETVAARAPHRPDESISLLPRPEGGGRDPDHARDGPDAVRGDLGHDGSMIRGRDAEIKRRYMKS